MTETADTKSEAQDSAASLQLQFLLGQSDNITRQIQFADTKAVTLFALIGVIAAHAALNIDEAEFASALVALIQIKAGIMALCLYVVLPRLANKEQSAAMIKTDQFSWPALASESYSPEQHAEFMKTGEAAQLVASVSRSNVIVAGILRRKFMILRWAFLLAMVDVPVTIILYLAS